MDRLNDLGQRSTVNKQILCAATIKSMRSHVNLFEINNKPLSKDFITATNVVKLINELKDKKGNPISTAYKIQIAATLKHLYGITIKTKKWTSEMKKPKARSTEFMKTIEQYVIFAAKAIVNIQTLDDITLYDTCITIIIIAATSLRIEEVHSLRLENFKEMRKSIPVKIKSKGSLVKEAQRDIVYNHLLEACYNALARNRKLYQTKALRITHVNNRFRHYRPNRLEESYVVVSSIQQMRRKLQEVHAILNISGEGSHGFTAFRKYITTLLMANGESQLARYMNNHSSLQTTRNHYDLSPQINTNEIQQELFGQMSGTQQLSGKFTSEPVVNKYSMPPTPFTPSNIDIDDNQ